MRWVEIPLLKDKDSTVLKKKKNPGAITGTIVIRTVVQAVGLHLGYITAY